MSSWTACRAIEAKAIKKVMAHLRKTYSALMFMDHRELQQVGDILAQGSNDQKVLEIKCESTEKYGNFFFESWSNRKRSMLGWIHKLKADVLIVYFLDTGNAYCMKVPELRDWLFEKGNLWKYPEKVQGKWKQKNESAGHLVKIADVMKNDWVLKEFVGPCDS